MDRIDKTFRSVLFESGDADEAGLEKEQPGFFSDLNLDQFVASLIAGREDYDLEPFFYTGLDSGAAVVYRHEVLRDLQRGDSRSCLETFAGDMRDMRSTLARTDKCRFRYGKQAWFLWAARSYSDAVKRLADDLNGLELFSAGLRGLRGFLDEYVRSSEFKSLTQDCEHAEQGLRQVEYHLDINGDKVTVSEPHEEDDYSEKVLEAFARFKQGEVEKHRFRISFSPEMDHIEGHILEFVARLNPDAFTALDDFCDRHGDYLDPTVARFDREVQFYLSILDFSDRMAEAGLSMCFPRLAGNRGDLGAAEAYDVALADRFCREHREVVVNGFTLVDPERILVVSGPNQGGKTTFARMFGQMHHLARIGCLVPGKNARLQLCDRIFTHFEREEDIGNLQGKLEDDLVRIHEILELATSDSIVIMNEIFTSTTMSDARRLGQALIEQIIDLGLPCVYVTFVEELASLNDRTVSMVSTVSDADTAERTFKVVRGQADGLAYAQSVAGKYGLTYDRMSERLAS